MTPNVHALIVEHEKTSKDLFGSVEVYTVSMCDVLVVLHVPRSCVIAADSGS